MRPPIAGPGRRRRHSPVGTRAAAGSRSTRPTPSPWPAGRTGSRRVGKRSRSRSRLRLCESSPASSLGKEGQSAAAPRLLVTAVARVEPTGYAWVDEFRREVADVGQPPLLREPVRATVEWRARGDQVKAACPRRRRQEGRGRPPDKNGRRSPPRHRRTSGGNALGAGGGLTGGPDGQCQPTPHPTLPSKGLTDRHFFWIIRVGRSWICVSGAIGPYTPGTDP